MLHELLLALMGNEGSVFRLEEFGMSICASVDFLSENERESLTEISQLGFWYQEITKRLNSPHAYTRALFDSIRESLKSYEGQVLGVERGYFESRLFSFCSIRAELHRYFSVLPRLAQVVRRIEEDKLKGGELLNYWEGERARCSEFLEDCMAAGSRALYRVFFTQLSNWMFYGKLVDRSD
jgi:hypothetical protein